MLSRGKREVKAVGTHRTGIVANAWLAGLDRPRTWQSRQRQQNLDPGGLSDILRQERNHIERTAPAGRGGLGGLLDADGDGQIVDDLAGIARRHAGQPAALGDLLGS